MFNKSKLNIFIVGLLFFSSMLFSSPAGKIKGRVIDENNNPLAGANITIEGTTMGAESDGDGYYYIIGIKAGTYNVRCQYVGYATKEYKKVKIREGFTKKLNFKLYPKDVALEEVTFSSSPAKIQMDVTSSSRSISRRHPRKGRKKELHFKGGRSGEVNYVIDGISASPGSGIKVNEPSANSHNTEEYNKIVENEFKTVKGNPLSTLSIDVDNASYSNVRRFINNNQMPYKDAVRIEEMINYFSYDYKEPQKNHPFSINTEISECPWNKKNKLIHIGLQGKRLDQGKEPKSNLVFLLDVSGSMNRPNKLPLLKKSFNILVNSLSSDDRVAIVVYAGAAGVVLPSTEVRNSEKIFAAIKKLRAGGSTAGGAGIKLAYKIAKENLIKGGNNRIVLATDGDFNVGTSSTSELIRLMEEKRKQGIFLTVIGFGGGNYKDARMESIADKGNGNYFYIDNILEAQKVLGNDLVSNFFTIAKDVKIQIEFNPTKVYSYRLIGYENRLLNKEDFDDDTKDAGELGAGHTVTALYEITPFRGQKSSKTDDLKYQDSKIKKSAKNSNEILTVKFRYKEPDEDKSKLITQPLLDKSISFKATSNNFKFSAAVAEFGMLLRDSKFKANSSYDEVLSLIKQSIGKDIYGYRQDFMGLVKKAKILAK